jgi:hypothetical protein
MICQTRITHISLYCGCHNTGLELALRGVFQLSPASPPNLNGWSQKSEQEFGYYLIDGPPQMSTQSYLCRPCWKIPAAQCPRVETSRRRCGKSMEFTARIHYITDLFNSLLCGRALLTALTGLSFITIRLSQRMYQPKG